MKNIVPKLIAANALFPCSAASVAIGLALASHSLVGQTLQGQNKGDSTTWVAGNLSGWAELDYIPMRVSFDAGSAGSRNVTLTFPHFSGKVFGFEDLSGFFLATPNVQFSTPPFLLVDASGNWSYTFTVAIADNNPADVRFFARLASGAHLYGGSSLQLKGSAGVMQFHKPSPIAGAPDLALTLSGSPLVLPGGSIAYTLTYTNQAPLDGATGVQITQVLPSEIIIDPATLPTNASIVGNTLFWDLGNLGPKANGSIAFTGTVAAATAPGTVLVDTAQIASAENDLNSTDNSTVFSSSVICGDAVPAIVSNPASAWVCPGDAATFSVSAVGPAAMSYQWFKDGSPIAGATSSSFNIAAVSAQDTGAYSVVATTPCATLTSAPATLGFRADLPIAFTGCFRQTDGSFVLNFGTGCGATYAIQYTQDFVTWTTSPVTVTGHGAPAQWVDASPNSSRFYRVVRIQ